MGGKGVIMKVKDQTSKYHEPSFLPMETVTPPGGAVNLRITFLVL